MLPPALESGQHPATSDRVISPNDTNAPKSPQVVSGFDDDWKYRYPSSTHSGDGVALVIGDTSLAQQDAAGVAPGRRGVAARITDGILDSIVIRFRCIVRHLLFVSCPLALVD